VGTTKSKSYVGLLSNVLPVINARTRSKRVSGQVVVDNGLDRVRTDDVYRRLRTLRQQAVLCCSRSLTIVYSNMGTR
jgi:hypothetical protein